jgi:Ca2+-binding EF-hand superfamily protein
VPLLGLSSSPPSTYRRHCDTIYGGLDYKRHVALDVPARYLAHMPKCDFERERRDRKRRKEQDALKDEMKRGVASFAIADEDGDGRLDFAEFVKLIMLQLRPPAKAGSRASSSAKLPPLPDREMLRDWFHVIDTDGSGQISITEYFAFSLREALARSCSDQQSLLDFLHAWDQNGDGTLDRNEFFVVAFALGFGSIGKELWELMDSDGDGVVTFGEFVRTLRSSMSDKKSNALLMRASRGARKASRATEEGRWKKAQRRILRVRMQAGQKGADGRRAGVLDPQTHLAIMSEFARVDLAGRRGAFYDPTLETTRAREDVDAPLSLLRSWMRASGFKALDTFQEWDSSGELLLTRRDLAKGLRELGLVIDRELLTLVFDRLAGGYHLEYAEWKAWFDDISIPSQRASFSRRGDSRGKRLALDEDAAALRIQRQARGFLARCRARKARLRLYELLDDKALPGTVANKGGGRGGGAKPQRPGLS